MSSCDWCEGLRVGGTLVAATDIPRHVVLGPYPGGLDFAAQTADRPAVDHVIKVSKHLYFPLFQIVELERRQ